MNTENALKILRDYMNSHARELGILEMGLFGSVASGRADSDSDVDVVVELDAPNYTHLARIKTDLESLFGVSVDVVRKRAGMSQLMRQCIEEDAVYA